MSPLRSLLLWASTRRWLGAQAQKRAFTRRAVRRFLPGEDLDAALLAAEKLAGQGSASVFHELGENVGTDAEADAALQHYRDVIERAASRKLEAHVSVKLTHLGLDLDRGRARDRIDALAGSAAASRGFVWMDMEGSAYTDATLDLYRYARERHDSVGICLQSYLFRTSEDLERLLPLAPWVRLVKGAYRESESVAHARKRDVDRALVEQSRRLLSDEARAQGARLALASHDVGLIDEVIGHARELGVAPGEYEIQTLYGIQAAKLRSYAELGHKTRVLISYGADWFPWYMRRLAERPANIWFLLRNLA